MNKPIAVTMLALLPLSTPALAASETVRCPAAHFIRAGGAEIRSTAIGFRNADTVNAATIGSVTFYDFFGIPVHQSVAGNHPLNTDITPPVDITTVPPNATYFMRTNHLWGTNPIPDLSDGLNGNQRGFAMTVEVRYSKAGDPKLFVVNTRLRSRQRNFNVFPASEGHELSSDTGECIKVKN